MAIDAEKGRRPLGDIHPWRAQTDRDRRSLLCARGRRAGRGRTAPDFHGSRRDQAGVRSWPHPRHSRCRSVPVIASGGVGELEHLVEGSAMVMPRCARGVDFPFRNLHGAAGQGIHGQGGHPMRLDASASDMFTLERLRDIVAARAASTDAIVLYSLAHRGGHPPHFEENRRGGGRDHNRRLYGRRTRSRFGNRRFALPFDGPAACHGALRSKKFWRNFSDARGNPAFRRKPVARAARSE